MPKHIQQPIADKVEPLKAPMFFLREKLRYGSPAELSQRGINGYWMASFHTSPPDFLSECIQQLRSFEISINEYDGGIDLQSRSSISIQTFKKCTKVINRIIKL